MRVPVSVIVAAVVVGLAVVAVTALLLPNKSGAPARPPAPVDTPAAADTGLDVRWRSGRMEGRDCIGTFEVKRGGGTRAQFVAFVMDTSGAIIARDSGKRRMPRCPGSSSIFGFAASPANGSTTGNCR